jgi:hypothetical protein
MFIYLKFYNIITNEEIMKNKDLHSLLSIKTDRSASVVFPFYSPYYWL